MTHLKLKALLILGIWLCILILAVGMPPLPSRKK